MRKIIFTFSFLAIACSGKAQLQNLNFEEWENPISAEEFSNKPVGWIRTNMVITNPEDYFYYAPATDAQNGDHAIRLSVWYNYTKDAATQTAPINSRPAALKGNYKYVDNVIYDQSGPLTDIAHVSVYLKKWNVATAQNDIVGWGNLDLNQSLSYSEFTVNINYVNTTAIPDTITVLLDPSLMKRYDTTFGLSMPNLGITSFFTVDNLSLVDASLNTAAAAPQNKIAIYPNPVENEINFDNFEGKVSIYDVYGKLLLLEQNITRNRSVVVNDLPSGIYFLRLSAAGKTETRKIIKR